MGDSWLDAANDHAQAIASEDANSLSDRLSDRTATLPEPIRSSLIAHTGRHVAYLQGLVPPAPPPLGSIEPQSMGHADALKYAKAAYAASNPTVLLDQLANQQVDSEDVATVAATNPVHLSRMRSAVMSELGDQWPQKLSLKQQQALAVFNGGDIIPGDLSAAMQTSLGVLGQPPGGVRGGSAREVKYRSHDRLPNQGGNEDEDK